MKRHYYVPIVIAGFLILAGAFLLLGERSRLSPVASDDVPRVYILSGSDNSVPYTAWSRDERLVLTGDGSNIILWDAASGRELRRLELSSLDLAPMAFLPDGKRFLKSGADSTVQIWDVASFTEVKRFRLPAAVRSLSLAGKGDRLFCTTSSPRAFLLDLKTGRTIREFPTDSIGSWAAAISADGRLVAAQGTAPRTITLWNAVNGERLWDREMSVATPICAAISADGTMLAAGSGDPGALEAVRSWGWGGERLHPDSAEIMVWSVADGERVCRLRPDTAWAVLTVQFAADGRHLISTAVDSVVSWWDLETCRLSSEVTSRPDNLVQTAILSADGRRVLTAGDKNMRIWNVAGNEPVRTFTVPAVLDGRAGLSADGAKVLVAPFIGHCREREFARELLIWDARTCRRESSQDPQPSRARYGFSENCRYGFAQIRTDTPRTSYFEFWSADSGLLGRTAAAQIWLSGSWDFSSDGRFAAMNINDSVYVLWETLSGREISRIHCSTPPYDRETWFTGLDMLAISDDGKHGVAGRQPGALLLDFDEGTYRHVRAASETELGKAPRRRISSDSMLSISAGQISADGQLALFTWFDHTVDVWDVPHSRLLYSYTAEGFESDGMVSSVSIARDKRTFVGAMNTLSYETWVRDGKVDTVAFGRLGAGGVWDLATGKLLRKFGENSIVTRICYSDDERVLVSTHLDGGVRLFNTATGKEIVRLVSFKNGEWLAVTPEGYYTASLNGDQFLNVRKGTQITNIEPYRSTFNQPKVVEAAMRLGDSEKAIAEVLGCKDNCTTIADLPDIEPPYLTVRYPENGDTLRSVDTTLAIRVEDRRYPIAAVKVFVNGRPVRSRDRDAEAMNIEIPPDRRILDLKLPLRLDEGDNLITITALGKSEALDTLRVHVLTDAFAGKMEIDTIWILAIGVNKYQDRKLRSLDYAANDAEELVKTFQLQEGRVCNKVMSLVITDRSRHKPTAATIADNLRFLKQAREEDLAVLFLAGHGVNDQAGDFYFLPSDAEVLAPGDFRASRAISGAQLHSAVDVPARRFVFVDACHSEGIGVDVVRLSREFKENRVLIMTSSEGSRPSEEADSLKHGLFTYALIEGLKGKADIGAGADAQVSAVELISYVSERVRSLTRNRQNPVFWAPGGLSNFIVAASPQPPVVHVTLGQ